jgi:hypothetical protein
LQAVQNVVSTPTTRPILSNVLLRTKGNILQLAEEEAWARHAMLPGVIVHHERKGGTEYGGDEGGRDLFLEQKI